MVRSCLGNSPPPPWPAQPVAEDPAHRAGAFVVRATTAAMKTGRGPLAFTTDGELRASLGISKDTHWRCRSHGVPKGSTALKCAVPATQGERRPARASTPGAGKFTATKFSAAPSRGGSDDAEGEIAQGQVPHDTRHLCPQPPSEAEGLKSPPEKRSWYTLASQVAQR